MPIAAGLLATARLDMLIMSRCGQELPRGAHPENEKTASRISRESPEDAGVSLLKAQISTAINTRRIALVLILAVFVSIISTLFGLWISVFEPDNSTAKAMITIWLVTALLVMIGGLFFIISSKRLTRP